MVTVLTLQPPFCLYLLGNPLATVRFEKSWGEICLGPGTNNEITSARLLSDLWLARVAWGLLLPGGQRKARAEAITMIVCSHNFLYFSVKYPEVDRLSFFFSFFCFFFVFLGKRLHSLERWPLFTAILDFTYPGKKPGRVTQPTHGVPPKSHFPFPA